MSRFIRSSLTALLTVGLFSCGGNDLPEVEGVTDQDATVIVVDHLGNLVDYVTVTPEMEVKRIEFLAPDSGEAIKAYAVGPNVHETIKSSFSVSTKVAEGHTGKIIVDVQDSIVTSVMGNMVSMTDPPSDELLREVGALKQAGDHIQKPTTVITLTDRKAGDLVEDEAGNLIPREMTAAEKEFLEEIIPAIKDKDIASLESLIHRRPGDTNSKGMLSFIEVALDRDMESYRFMRIHPEHPEHSEILTQGHSLPICWILRIQYGKKDAPYTHVDLFFGEEDGEFRLPTKYGTL
jgi:hypothetical protein